VIGYNPSSAKSNKLLTKYMALQLKRNQPGSSGLLCADKLFFYLWAAGFLAFAGVKHITLTDAGKIR
jgi:hypothetical protein